jgi:hypothetical protein
MDKIADFLIYNFQNRFNCSLKELIETAGNDADLQEVRL